MVNKETGKPYDEREAEIREHSDVADGPAETDIPGYRMPSFLDDNDGENNQAANNRRSAGNQAKKVGTSTKITGQKDGRNIKVNEETGKEAVVCGREDNNIKKGEKKDMARGKNNRYERPESSTGNFQVIDLDLDDVTEELEETGKPAVGSPVVKKTEDSEDSYTENERKEHTFLDAVVNTEIVDESRLAAEGKKKSTGSAALRKTEKVETDRKKPAEMDENPLPVVKKDYGSIHISGKETGDDDTDRVSIIIRDRSAAKDIIFRKGRFLPWDFVTFQTRGSDDPVCGYLIGMKRGEIEIGTLDAGIRTYSTKYVRDMHHVVIVAEYPAGDQTIKVSAHNKAGLYGFIGDLILADAGKEAVREFAERFGIMKDLEEFL